MAKTRTLTDWNDINLEYFSLFASREQRAWEKYKNETKHILDSDDTREVAVLTKTSTLNNILLYGLVQSGKTTSLICLAALAKDKGYNIVINLAGTNWNLLGQSEKRFKQSLGGKYLKADEGWGERYWEFYLGGKPPARDDQIEATPSINVNNKKETIERIVGAIRENKSTMILALKNSAQIDNIRDVIGGVQTVVSPLKILIIDDESDQTTVDSKASDNFKYIKRVGSQEDTSELKGSPTYQSLKRLKCTVEDTTFVQSTATPQCNILAAQYCLLRPTFIKVVKPGVHYYGGSYFFEKSSVGACQVINFPGVTKAKKTEGAVETQAESHKYPKVREAIYSYFFSCFQHIFDHLEANQELENRSMIFHESVKNEEHSKLLAVVQKEIDNQLGDLQKGKLTYAKTYYNRWRNIVLACSEKQPQAMDKLLNKKILDIFRNNISCREINRTTSKQSIEWNRLKFQVFCGGYLLDRGFTIEKLIVSYIGRRRMANRNASAMQQWGRFFGYREGYVEHCRIFIDDGVENSFKEYIEHETDLRESLLEAERIGIEQWLLKLRHIKSGTFAKKSCIGIHLDKFGEFEKWIEPKGLHFLDLMPSARGQEKQMQNQKVFKELAVFLRDKQIDLNEFNSLRTGCGQKKYDEPQNADDYYYILRNERDIEKYYELILPLNFEDSAQRNSFLNAVKRTISDASNQKIFIVGLGLAFTDDPVSSKRNLTDFTLKGRGNRRGKISSESDLTIESVLTFHFRYLDLVPQAKSTNFVARKVPWFSMKDQAVVEYWGERTEEP